MAKVLRNRFHLHQSVSLNRLYRKSQWLAPCMIVCVRVSFMSGPNPSAMVKSALQTSRNPSSGSPNSFDLPDAQTFELTAPGAPLSPSCHLASHLLGLPVGQKLLR